MALQSANEIARFMLANPRSEAMKAHLIKRALRIVGLTYPTEDDFYIEAYLVTGPGLTYKDLIRRGDLLASVEMKALGLNPRIKLARQFYNTLAPEGRRDFGTSAVRIAFGISAALRNREQLTYFAEEFGPRCRVKLIGGGAVNADCEQLRREADVTWASVAPDLPLPGCNAQCGCRHILAETFNALTPPAPSAPA